MFSFFKGLDSSYRRGIDYGFPADELSWIKSEHDTVDVFYNIDTESMEVWSDTGSRMLYLFEVDKTDTYKVKGMLDESRTNRMNSQRKKNGEYPLARKVLERNEARKKEQEKSFMNSLDKDRIACNAADALDMRGMKGAPRLHVGMGKK